MPAPKKRDYTEIAPAVVESYLKERNVLKVSRLFSMSPRSVKAILDEHHVKVGRSGANNLKHHNKKAPMPQDCCISVTSIPSVLPRKDIALSTVGRCPQRIEKYVLFNS